MRQRYAWLAFFLVAAAPLNAATPSGSSAPDAEVVRSVSEDADVMVVLPGEVSVAPALFSRLKEDAEEVVRSFMVEAAEERKEVKDRDPAAELPPYSLRIDYQPQFFSPDFLSLLRAADIYTGGAHGMVGFEGLIYDLRSRSIVEPQDILDGGAGWEENQKALTALVLESLKALKRERLGADYDPERDDSWLQDFALPLDTMTLLASSEPAKIGGLAFHIGPYIAGPYAEGTYQVDIPAAKLAPMLGDQWRERFGGEPISMAYVRSAADTKGEFILLAKPRPGDRIETRVVEISGEAPPSFFRNDAFPVEVAQDDGTVLANATASADRSRPAAGIALNMVPFAGKISVPGDTQDVLIRLGTQPMVTVPVTLAPRQ